jgi:CDP-6-deoxy-D-xylo-4-hexulose-3-dehydrase
MLGTFSKIGTYSFFRSHHISTMEGGMLVTDEEELAIYAKSLRAHGWARNITSNNFLNNSDKEPWKSKFKFYLPGYNVRPLEISGAVGEIQLKKIDSFLKNRRENADLLKTMLKDFEFLALQNQSESGSWMAFALLANSISRDKIVMLLEENNVETRPIVTGNFTNQPVIEKIRNSISISGDLKNSQIVEDCGFMIANHGRVLEKEILAIGKILENFY